MAIKQTIKFNSKNEYFAGFLQNIVDVSDIKGGVTFENDKVVLVLDDSDTDSLENFSNNAQKLMPHSVFMGNIDTDNEQLDIKSTRLKSKNYNIALCPTCLDILTNPASSDYLNDSIVCSHYSNDIEDGFNS